MKREERLHGEGKLGRGEEIGYRAAWIWYLGVLFLTEGPFSAVMPGFGFEQTNRSRRKTGPDRARPGQTGFTETEKGSGKMNF